MTPTQYSALCHYAAGKYGLSEDGTLLALHVAGLTRGCHFMSGLRAVEEFAVSPLYVEAVVRAHSGSLDARAFLDVFAVSGARSLFDPDDV